MQMREKKDGTESREREEMRPKLETGEGRKSRNMGTRRNGATVFWPDLESKNSSEVCLVSSCCQVSLSTQAILQTTADSHRSTYTHTNRKGRMSKNNQYVTQAYSHTLEPTMLIQSTSFPHGESESVLCRFPLWMPYVSVKHSMCICVSVTASLALSSLGLLFSPNGGMFIVQHAVLGLQIGALLLIILQHARTWRFIGEIQIWLRCCNVPTLNHYFITDN